MLDEIRKYKQWNGDVIEASLMVRLEQNLLLGIASCPSTNATVKLVALENELKVFGEKSWGQSMQEPPRWCPWISTAKSDLDSFLSARKRFCDHFPSKHI